MPPKLERLLLSGRRALWVMELKVQSPALLPAPLHHVHCTEALSSMHRCIPLDYLSTDGAVRATANSQTWLAAAASTVTKVTLHRQNAPRVRGAKSCITLLPPIICYQMSDILILGSRPTGINLHDRSRLHQWQIWFRGPFPRNPTPTPAVPWLKCVSPSLPFAPPRFTSAFFIWSYLKIPFHRPSICFFTSRYNHNPLQDGDDDYQAPAIPSGFASAAGIGPSAKVYRPPVSRGGHLERDWMPD